MDLLHSMTFDYASMRPVYKFVLVFMGTLIALSAKSHVGASGVAAGMRGERAKERATQEELDVLMRAAVRLSIKGDLLMLIAALCLFFAGEV